VQLARAVAVLGAGATLGRAAELAELPFEEAASEADVLIRADVARDAERLEIAHPLVRAAVLGELTSVARAALHARAARLLAADGASPETVGAHLLAAPRCRDPWVVDRLVAAAERARGAGAPEAAARLLQRALDEPPPDGARAAIHAALGSALCTAGDARGIDHITIARELTSDASQRVMLGVRLGTPYLFLGRGEEVAAMLREALAEAGHGDPFTFLIRAGQASAPMFGARFDPRELTAELLEEVRQLEPLPLFARPAVGGLAMVACAAAFPAAGTAATARLAIGELEDHRTAIAEGFPLLPALLALGLAGHVDGLEERLALVEDGVRRRGAIALGLCVLLCTRAALDLHEGAIDAALAHASAAGGGQRREPVQRAARPEPRAARGGAARTRRPARRRAGLGRPSARRRRRHVGCCGTRGAGRARAGKRRPRDRDAGGARGRRPRRPDRGREPGGRTVALGRGACAQGQRRGRPGGRSVDRAARACAGVRHPRGDRSALRVHALVLDELELLEQAERTLAGARARLEHARALIDLGAALRRDGRRVRARDPLFAGMDQARRCGSPPLVEHALTELRAAGARPRTVVRSGLDALTPSELRIAQHAARGHTNREIAAELFVTKATVETHLRSVFRKLDVSARGELGERLAGSTTSFPR
jgi:DNA-binding CsgD family transcriptional regulator